MRDKVREKENREKAELAVKEAEETTAAVRQELERERASLATQVENLEERIESLTAQLVTSRARA